jgi:hypothetical protein
LSRDDSGSPRQRKRPDSKNKERDDYLDEGVSIPSSGLAHVARLFATTPAAIIAFRRGESNFGAPQKKNGAS